jgi:hypothetical protein
MRSAFACRAGARIRDGQHFLVIFRRWLLSIVSLLLTEMDVVLRCTSLHRIGTDHRAAAKGRGVTPFEAE